MPFNFAQYRSRERARRIRLVQFCARSAESSRRYQGWKMLGVPTKITKSDGAQLDPGAVIREVLEDGDTVCAGRAGVPRASVRRLTPPRRASSENTGTSRTPWSPRTSSPRTEGPV